MAAFLLSASSDLSAATGRRLRRDRVISGWRRKLLIISLLTVTISALLAITLPSASSRTSLSTASVDRPPLPFSPNKTSSRIPYSPNSSIEDFLPPPSASQMLTVDALDSKIDDHRLMFIDPSNSEVSESHLDDSEGNWKAPDSSEIQTNIVKKSGVNVWRVPATTSSEAVMQMPLRYRSTDEALIYAKKEIEDAPFVIDDTDLYAPLFLNVSVFKRSYELMERILKVYIYRDGQRPIFHTPYLKGIYASEGWFMRLIQQSKHFVVKDPSQAHLFYLPYSIRRLEFALYIPGSHDMKPLSRFLRDYVNRISSKYPFWNRTRGSDHFLVACHDWGPYTTTLHAELHKNTIKALCNADASEGIFVKGKDVSLPETTIRTPKRPLKHVGGRPVSRRPILAFFAGNMHGRVRPILLQHWGNGRDQDMRIFGPLPNQIARKMSYIDHMKSSKFCICPMGFEVNSPRIVEAIYYECVPVIIADNFVLPFEEVLDWSTFSIVVPERDIPRLKEILLGIPKGKYAEMQECVKRVQKHFLWHARPEKYDLFHMILHSIWLSRLNNMHPP